MQIRSDDDGDVIYFQYYDASEDEILDTQVEKVVISNRLNDIGLPMSYHSHMGTLIQSENDVEKFLELTNENTYLFKNT